MEEIIKIPIYFYQDENKEVHIDEDEIYRELRNKLNEIQEKPENFLELEL